MKFSYKLLKNLAPSIKNKQDVVEKLNLHSFEAVNLGGDVLDIILPPNRYDAAGHIGIAKEISAAYGKRFKNSKPKTQNLKLKIKAPFRVVVKDRNLCPRYSAQYFENVKIKPSPKWLKDILTSCGLRPINNVVDIMNYVMLETGQPMHAFDFDKLAADRIGQKTIFVRRAQEGERIAALDDNTYALSKNFLLIADEKGPLAIAGIKGGKRAEVGGKTKTIVVEAACFEQANIYKTSKILALMTDASNRFSRGLSPELVPTALARAAELLAEIAGAKTGGLIDVYPNRQQKKIIKFDVQKFNKFIGAEIGLKEASHYLELLGFVIKKSPRASFLTSHLSFLVEVPSQRLDIETFEDLAEEVVRLYGYNELKSEPPHIHLHPSGFEDQIVLKNKIRKILIGLGFSEVYNYSFISEKEGQNFNFNKKLIELENPVSAEFHYLRSSLTSGLLKNIEDNLRFFSEFKIFEIGKIFYKEDNLPAQAGNMKEKPVLGLAVASQEKDQFLKLKGGVNELFKKSGLVDYLMFWAGENENFSELFNDYFDKSATVEIKSGLPAQAGNEILGYFGYPSKTFDKPPAFAAICQIDLEKLLKLVVEEHEYRPLPKYPSVMRDISILVDRTARVGDIMQAIQEINLKLIDDVDLIDEYDDKTIAPNRSLTFRIVFQAADRTLTSDEIRDEMAKIKKVLEHGFGAKIR